MVRKMIISYQEFWINQKGGASLEYLLIAMGVALAFAAAGVAFQDQLAPLFEQVKNLF
jgi:Flp pilus assembly pilin Flp